MSKVEMFLDKLSEKKTFILRKYKTKDSIVFTIDYKDFSYSRVYSNNPLIDKNTFDQSKHRELDRLQFGSFVGARNYILLNHGI